MIESENEKKRHDRLCDGGNQSNSIEDLNLLFCYATLHQKEKEISTLAIQKYGRNIYAKSNEIKQNKTYPCKSMCSNYDKPIMFTNKMAESRHNKTCELCKLL